MIKLISSFILLLTMQSAFALAPTTISDPVPAIPSLVNVSPPSTHIYTITNNVPDHTFPVTISGLSGVVTRTTVSNDCGNSLPAGPSTCNIGILISPTSVSAAVTNQTISINYQGRTPLTNQFTFSVPAFLTTGLYNTNTNSLPLFLRSVDNGNSWIPPSSVILPNDFVAVIDQGVEPGAGTSCSQGICVRVGKYDTNNPQNTRKALIMRSTDLGQSWAFRVAPLPADAVPGGFTLLVNVKCLANFCVAVGYYPNTGFGFGKGLFLMSNDLGNSWNTSSATLPAFTATSAPGLTPNALFCNDAVCIASGIYQSFLGLPVLLSTTNHGVSWIGSSLPAPSDYHGAADIGALTCQGNLCIAGGSYDFATHRSKPFLVISHDNGSSWVAPSTINLPVGFQAGGLISLACSNNACIAVGGYSTTGNSFPLFLITTNGNVWNVPSVTLPSNFEANRGISSMTCMANDCIAVGTYTNLINPLPLILVSHDGGSSWSPASVTLPGGSQVFQLSNVTCINSTCSVVGQYSDSTPLILRSTDKGNTWTPPTSITFPSDYVGDSSLTSVLNTTGSS